MSVTEQLASVRPVSGHRTLAERAFGTLHEAIVTGLLGPGQRLPIEELAQTLGLSPMPIREALRQLDTVGLVENTPHRGATVSRLSLGDLREVYETRLALESLAIWHAAEMFTEEDALLAWEALEAHMSAYRSNDLGLLGSTHTAFHLTLYNAAHSRWLIRLIAPLLETSERYRFAVLPVRPNLNQSRSEHEQIIEACMEHNPMLACTELQNHLARTANLIAKQMGGGSLSEVLTVASRSQVRSPPAPPVARP